MALSRPDLLGRLAEEMTDSLLYVEGMPYAPGDGELPGWFRDPVAETVWNVSHVHVRQAHPIDEDSYRISGALRGDAQIYSVLPGSEWEAVAGDDRGRLDEVVDHGNGEVAVIFHRPVSVEFDAVLTPPSEVSDVVVLSVEPQSLDPTAS